MWTTAGAQIKLADPTDWISECEDIPFILKSLTFYWAIQENLLFNAKGKKKSNFFHSVA